MNATVERVRAELKLNADPKVAASVRRFFKETIRVHGVATPQVRRIAQAQFKQLPDQRKDQVWPLCQQLWQSGYLEEAVVASLWAYALRKTYGPEDFKWFEKWVGHYVHNWAACDTLCNHTLGAFLEMYPAFLKNLRSWAVSRNLWLRRAAAVSLIVPAKQGKFLKEACGLADLLLRDPEDLVQKGYGWLLKAAAHRHQAEIFKYVMKNKAAMPRTALRYAIEKMPRILKRQAMAK